MKRIRKLCIIFVMCIPCMLLCSCGKQDKGAGTEVESRLIGEEKQGWVTKGKTEDGVTYQYDMKSKTLTMSGKIIKGACPENYSKDTHGEIVEKPWQKWDADTKKIVFKEGVECVTDSAFDQFVNVDEIVFPRTLKKIGFRAFFELGIAKLTLPSSVEEIGREAFSRWGNNRKIEEVQLPESLCRIDQNAFNGQSISSIKIPENVKFIGEEAFAECEELKKVIIGSKKIKEIGESVFFNVFHDVTVYVPKEKIKKYRKMLSRSSNAKVRPLK